MGVKIPTQLFTFTTSKDIMYLVTTFQSFVVSK